MISPWAKPHYVSHTPRDTTAILAFIEETFNVPPLTNRDAYYGVPARDMSEFFDFTTPALLNAPDGSAWSTFLPQQPTEQVITNFPVRVGDEIYTEVSMGDAAGDLSLSGIFGRFLIMNLTTGQVSQLLAACSDDLVPVTPIAGRSGVITSVSPRNRNVHVPVSSVMARMGLAPRLLVRSPQRRDASGHRHAVKLLGVRPRPLFEPPHGCAFLGTLWIEDAR